MKTAPTYILFIALTLGASSALGLVATPDEWYANLAKPSFNPPNWIFAPVWTVLYIMIAVAGARTFLRDRQSRAMKLWATQIILNFLWTPLFFLAHRIDAALALIVILLATIAAYIKTVAPTDKPAALLFAPYLAWVSFATLLNAALFWMNK